MYRYVHITFVLPEKNKFFKQTYMLYYRPVDIKSYGKFLYCLLFTFTNICCLNIKFYFDYFLNVISFNRVFFFSFVYIFGNNFFDSFLLPRRNTISVVFTYAYRSNLMYMYVLSFRIYHTYAQCRIRFILRVSCGSRMSACHDGRFSARKSLSNHAVFSGHFIEKEVL